MKIHISTYIPKPCKVLDVGSINVRGKGSYKQLLTDEYDYTGLDLEAGDNVDVVIDDPYSYPFQSDTFDAVLCGQVLEHCEHPHLLIQECARVLKPGGVFLGVAPFVFKEHKYPVDCWRLLPDGWKVLFRDADLGLIDTYLHRHKRGNVDCWGIARA